MTFKVESSSYKPYVGETHTQRICFTQNEAAKIGNGEKWEYNGKLFPFDIHRKLEYQGTVNSDVLKATYVLHSLKRLSEGMIDVIISSNGKSLERRLSGNAGETAGTIIGKN